MEAAAAKELAALWKFRLGLGLGLDGEALIAARAVVLECGEIEGWC